VKTEGKRTVVKSRNRRKYYTKLYFGQLVVQLWTEGKWLKMEFLGRNL